jgi:two-component system LytT family sensor kinase
MGWILRNRAYYYVFAVVFFIFWFLFKVGGVPDIPRALLSTFIDVCVGMAALLITVEMLLPKLVYRHKYGLFSLCFFLLVFACGSIIILSQSTLDGSSILEYSANVAKSPKHYFYWFWADLIFGSYFLVFFISSAGAAIRFAFDRVQALNMVEKLEKEKVLAELDLLKNQVNPHFLFNALNTIFYKIDRANQPARETLERFSKMLRYQLYDCNSEYIEIEKELAFLSSYIELQKERLNGNYRVECRGFDEINGLKISPFLLMPVIENCFKHVSNFADKENYIVVECSRDGHIFCIRAVNSVDKNAVNEKGGIGLVNIRRRLQLMYKGLHALNTEENDTTFKLQLKITLA